jgi:NAD(P)-dependent dehydrogenase (short-subunit alcohol dehydrogenase family)
VLVTGGSSGLGAAVAAAVRDAGGVPVVLDVKEPQDGLAFQRADLARPREAEGAVRRIAEDGGLDAVVTCAGTDVCGRLDDVSAEDWERVVRVNLFGTAAVVRASIPHLERSGGKVVTVASTLGLRGVGDATAYCASKFGVVGVTLLIPGGMQTQFFDGRPEQYRPPADAALNDPNDVAGAVLFALRQPRGCEVRELVIAPSSETSWP